MQIKSRTSFHARAAALTCQYYHLQSGVQNQTWVGDATPIGLAWLQLSAVSAAVTDGQHVVPTGLHAQTAYQLLVPTCVLLLHCLGLVCVATQPNQAASSFGVLRRD